MSIEAERNLCQEPNLFVISTWSDNLRTKPSLTQDSGADLPTTNTRRASTNPDANILSPGTPAGLGLNPPVDHSLVISNFHRDDRRALIRHSRTSKPSVSPS